jgi:hypothetical protein
VKTTLELPESLVREAEAAARAKGVPLDDFLAAVLRERLERRFTRSRRDWPVPPPAVDIEETRRIQKVIDVEFGKIEWENWR